MPACRYADVIENGLALRRCRPPGGYVLDWPRPVRIVLLTIGWAAVVAACVVLGVAI